MSGIVDALEEGSRVGSVILEAAIDRGGYGIVYRAKHDSLGLVAVKEFFPKMVASRSRSSDKIVQSGSRSDAQAFEKGLQKFLAEARVLERLNHPNVVKFHEVIEANGTAYLVMEFAVGQTLGDFIRNHPEEIDERFSRRVALDIAGALDALHAEGIIHQDVAPDNIIIEKTTKRPILIDFGGAKQVVHGYTELSEAALVKRGFSPPEQYSKGDVKGLERGPWSDLYGLSAVLYNLVTGEPPQDSITRLDTDHMPSARKAGADRAGSALLRAIDWGLNVSPQKRPQYVSEWLEVAEGTSRPAFKIALPNFKVDPKVFVAIGAVLVLALVGTGAVRLVSGLTDNWAFDRAMTGDCKATRSYISKQRERSYDPGLLQISQWCDARDYAFGEDTLDAFGKFARNFPPNRIPETARQALSDQTELALWAKVQVADSLSAYMLNLSLYPEGTYAAEAAVGVEALRASVAELQQRLKSIGLYTSVIDGDPGAGTQRATNSLANAKGIDSLDLLLASNTQIGDFIRLAAQEEQRIAAARAQAERERLEQEQRLAEERAKVEAEARRLAAEQERKRQSDAEARRRQAKLDAERADFQRARNTKTRAAYNEFLRKHPNGQHAGDVQALITTCRNTTKQEWVRDSFEHEYFGSSSNRSRSTSCSSAKREARQTMRNAPPCDFDYLDEDDYRNVRVGALQGNCDCYDLGMPPYSDWHCDYDGFAVCSWDYLEEDMMEVCN